MNDFFALNIQSCIGVFLLQDMLCYAALERTEEGKLHIFHADVCKIFPEHSDKFSPSFPHVGELAEEFSLCCAKAGIEERRMVVCVPAEKFIAYTTKLPAFTQKEMAEAMLWEVEANTPFVTQVYTYRKIEGNTYDIRILDAVLAKELYDAFHENGFDVMAILGESEALPENHGSHMEWDGEMLSLPIFFTWEKFGAEAGELRQAAFGAWQLMRGISYHENFLPIEKQEGSLDWKKVAAAVLLPLLFFWMFLFGMGAWKLTQLSSERAALERELLFRADEQKRQQDFVARNEAVQSSVDVLQSLGKKQTSWYAVFTLLGTETMPGVIISGIETAENGTVRIRGEAESYEHITEYLTMWEDEADFMTKLPALESVEASTGGSLKFSLLFVP